MENISKLERSMLNVRFDLEKVLYEMENAMKLKSRTKNEKARKTITELNEYLIKAAWLVLDLESYNFSIKN